MDNNEQKIGMKENCGKGIIGTTNQNVEGMQELTEEMSSASINKNASVEIENNEQKSAKNRLKFGGWLSYTLDWMKRPELAQTSLSTSSYTFNQYCWPKLHGNKVKPHIVPRLTIFRRQDGAGNWQTILRKDDDDDDIEIPIAGTNPPKYIIGFERINFTRFIDDRALQFVQNILPLLNESKLRVPCIGFGGDPQFGPIKHLIEMLAPPKTNKLIVCENETYELSKFNEQFPNFIPGLQSINLIGRMKTDMDFVLKWLTTPMEDGKPKMFETDTQFTISRSQIEASINRVKTEFIHSTVPANFIIRMFCHGDDEEVEGQGPYAKRIVRLFDNGFVVRCQLTTNPGPRHRKSWLSVDNELSLVFIVNNVLCIYNGFYSVLTLSFNMEPVVKIFFAYRPGLAMRISKLRMKQRRKYSNYSRKNPKNFLVRHKNDTETTAKVDWEEQMELKSNTLIFISSDLD